MEKFKGKPDSIRKLGIIFIISSLLTVVIFVFIPNFGLKIFLLIICILFALYSYKGLIISINIDDQKIKIYKPLNVTTIKFDNVAFCAIHGIDEETTLLYAFMRKKWFKRDRVSGISSKKSFDEIVKIVSQDEGNTDLNINFNMAFKVLTSFVLNGDVLRDKILSAVNERHKKII
ncbi:hypothetical protein [Clostridium sp.]|uniref:hypothetical protein n=1 Tax=Clostridium sp. TaxID=1506 RepID=UPI001A36BE7C|nr:hypothetical protein [Clostridium sp.]MBK5235918.1 hypothetical protein [Clostridium sp.]